MYAEVGFRNWVDDTLFFFFLRETAAVKGFVVEKQTKKFVDGEERKRHGTKGPQFGGQILTQKVI